MTTPSDVCPRCGAHIEPVVYGNVLAAECDCGWRGSKRRPTA